MATGGGSRYVGPTVQATIREQASATASDHDGTSARREAVTAGLVAAGDWVSVIAVVPGRKWWLRSTSPARLPPAATGWRGCRSARSEEHTSELQSLMRISYAVFCLK